jgi:hypothetical protein
MSCENGGHLWRAAFFRRGAVAFWFCECCGETDRDIEQLDEPLEQNAADSGELPSFTGERPPAFLDGWLLKDGSVLRRLEPCSVFFGGKPLPELPESHEFMLTLAETGETREYRARLDRSSNYDNSFMITRYAIDGDRLMKYRTHCRVDLDTGETTIDPPSVIAIISGLRPNI